MRCRVCRPEPDGDPRRHVVRVLAGVVGVGSHDDLAQQSLNVGAVDPVWEELGGPVIDAMDAVAIAIELQSMAWRELVG